jgi:hypothetical protein
MPLPLPDVWWPAALGAKAAPAPKKNTGKAARAKVQRLACPELAAADKAELSSVTPRPTHWPDKGASRGELEKHVDALELSEASKVAAAKRVLAEHDRCRGGQAKGKSP